MRILSTLIAAAALIATPALADTASVAAKGEVRLAEALQGYVPGEPVSCLPINQVRNTEVIDGTAILYRVGRKLYVNRPEIGAESLRGDPVLVTKTYGSQLCNIDTVNLVDRTSRFWRGFVGLGKFVPYTKADATR